MAVIPPQSERKNPSRMPHRRFKYDGKRERVRCPGGKILRRHRWEKSGWIYRARSSDCRQCVHRSHCVTPSGRARTVLILHDYEALLRARRWWARCDEDTREKYRRHQWRVEGKHGEGKTQHGLRRAVRRGLANVAIQVYLTAAAMNLKVLAGLLSWLRIRPWRSQGAVVASCPPAKRDFGRNRGIKELLDLAA